MKPPRRKVVKSWRSYIVGWYDCKLECGHTLGVQGWPGTVRIPKTMGCHPCTKTAKPIT